MWDICNILEFGQGKSFGYGEPCNLMSNYLQSHIENGCMQGYENENEAVLLKYGRPVAKCDPWIHRATQGPTIDGPFGDQWFL